MKRVGRPNKLKSVAAGVLGSFVSRNNDVGGYWALGQLRAQCLSQHVSQIRFDLLAGTASLDDGIAQRVAVAYRQFVLRQLQCNALDVERLRGSVVVLDFAPNEPVTVKGYASYGDPFSCVVQLENDRGRVYAREYVGRCVPHDPTRELRSSRG